MVVAVGVGVGVGAIPLPKTISVALGDRAEIPALSITITAIE